MKKPKLLLLIPLLLLSILPVLPSVIPRAHAATGTVCLTSSSTTCPTTAEVFFASVGSQLTVNVVVTGSDALNGFDIYVSADHSVLSAVDASLTGTILGTGTTTLAKCIDGALITGSTCTSKDGLGVVHLAATKSGALVAGNGLLFSVIYNVVALSPGTPISLFSVTVSNGTGTPDSETTLSGTFSNQTDFGITASPASLQTASGTPATSTITLTSFGGFSDFINFATASTAGLTASTSDAGLFLPPDSAVTTTLTVTGTTSGSVTVTGSGTSITHSVTVPVTITPQSFTVTASPASFSTAPGTSVSSTITVTSVSSFAGTVSLVATVSPAGPTATLAPSMVTPTATSTLTINVPAGTASGAYTVTVTGTGSVGTHSATVSLTVGEPDFSIAAIGNQIVVLRTAPLVPAGTFFALQSVNNFAATLSLSTTVNFAFIDTPGSATLPFSMQNSVVLPAGGTVNAPFSATVGKTAAGTGMYLVTVTATGGGKTHVATLQIWVIDYTVAAQDSVITMANVPGTFGQDPLSIGAIGAPHNATGFNLNPGTTEGVAAFPTNPGYDPGAHGASSSNGISISSALGLDVSNTARRCFLEVFDSSGNLIQPVYNSAGTKVVSFAAPLVHLNGDQFGFPPAFNGCRFDSFWYVDPVNGNTLGSTTDTDLVTVEPLTTTPNGVFTTLVCLQAGGDINCVTLTINMVPPPAAPALNQFTGRTATVSLAAGGQGNFKVGITNQDPSTTVYVSVTITAVSSDGKTTITGTSGVVAIPAFGKVNNIAVSLDFSKAPAGTTFSETVVINYGVAPHYLTLTSSQTIGTALKLTGSVIVTP